MSHFVLPPTAFTGAGFNRNFPVEDLDISPAGCYLFLQIGSFTTSFVVFRHTCHRAGISNKAGMGPGRFHGLATYLVCEPGVLERAIAAVISLEDRNAIRDVYDN